MKSISRTVLASLFLIGASFLRADSPWSSSSSIYSKYIGRNGAIFSEDPILVNELDWSKGNIFAGVWNSTGIDKHPYGSTYADELDLYVGYVRTFELVKVKTDVAYYTIKDLSLISDDLWAIDGEISLPKMAIAEPYVSFRKFNQISSKSFPQGMFYWAGLRRKQWGLNLDWMTAYSDGALGKDPGLVFTRLSVSHSFALNKRVKLSPSVLFQKPIGGQERHRRAYTTKNETIWGLTLDYTP